MLRTLGLVVLLMMIAACSSPPSPQPRKPKLDEAAIDAGAAIADAGSIGPVDTGVPEPADLDAGAGAADRVEPDAEIYPDAAVEPPPASDDPLAALPRGAAQLAILCARNNTNAVARAFCSSPTPAVTSITDLQSLLGLTTGNPDEVAFALTGHTTSISTRKVSPINPRAIVFTRARNTRADGERVVLAYARGDQLIELAVSRVPGELTFYLLRYQQPCNATRTCGPTELLTPATDSGFTDWSLYEDIDLANTTLDCLSCHQPQGPSTPKILRMQELTFPWIHWFGPRLNGGRVMIETFEAAHGTTENYGPIPAGQIDGSRPSLLQEMLEEEGFGTQPNAFDSSEIQEELEDEGDSPTWNTLYQRAVDAEEIPPPYFDLEITDPTKLTAMTTSYAEFRAGTLAILPDISDVLLESALDEMSIRPKEGLDGAGIIRHMCGQCHNPRLDPTLSRARFDVTALATMSRAERDEAIRRLSLPSDDRYAMPPHFLKELSANERAAAIAELMR